MAWVKFCEQFALECSVSMGRSRRHNRADAAGLEHHRRRDTAGRTPEIKPITDKDHWVLLDRWEFPDDGMGDC